MDALAKTSPDRIHLVILIHGLYGSPANLETVDEEVHRAAESRSSRSEEGGDAESETEVDDLLDCASRLKSVPSRSLGSTSKSSSSAPGPLRVVTLLVSSFTGSHTWDGIDVNAYRARREIMQEIDRLAEQGGVVEGLSVMGYSLGGLVGRFLVGLLDTSRFWETYTPISFSTAATPHLGVLKYQSRVNTVVHTVGKRLFSRSGQQLYNLDRDESARSLLEIMAEPDEVFMRALRRFPRIMIVANGCHDATVPYPSASISLTDPFDSFHITGLQTVVHQNILLSWSYPETSDLDPDTQQRPDGETKVKVTSTTDTREYRGIDGVMRRRPRLPPILFLPYPFTYVLVALLPLIIPLWFILASSITIYHTFQSRQRHRLHLVDMGQPIVRGSLPNGSRDPRSIASNGAASQVDESTPLLDPLSGDQSPSAPISRTETPPLHPLPVSSLNTPPSTSGVSATSDSSHRPGQIPLLLTPQQKRMVRNLNAELPQMNRIIGWFPWAFNAHALLIVRSKKQFPWHEEGRGVVRAWAEYVVDSPRVMGLEGDQTQS